MSSGFAHKSASGLDRQQNRRGNTIPRMRYVLQAGSNGFAASLAATTHIGIYMQVSHISFSCIGTVRHL